MHYKTYCFALQKSRFRNAKTQLPFFNEIIFTKPKIFSASVLSKKKEINTINNIL